jgi:hypothetical protein
MVPMGRTVPSFRIALAQEQTRWRAYRRRLGPAARKDFDALFAESRLYASAASAAVRAVRFEGVLMTVLFHHQKQLEGIAEVLEQIRLSEH